MVIQTSNVSLASKSYTSVAKYESVRYGNGYGRQVAGLKSSAPTADGSTGEPGKLTDMSELYELCTQRACDGLFETERASESESFTETLETGQRLEFASLENIFRILDRNTETKKITAKDLLEIILERLRKKAEMLIKDRVPSGGAGLYGTGSLNAGGISERYVNMEVTKITAYTESTSFESMGTVTTADGREMGFSLSFSKTQRFSEATNVTINFRELYLTDPLVISLDDNPAKVEDQKFTFDIDCDGEEDNISLLGKMSGFLALDGNNDGVINDGSELFGARTGDGFKELAVFDLDGNGWIDENDEVFNRLRIWTKEPDGTDRLVALGVAGIGAIYLGNVDTQIKAVSADEDLNGIVRKSGIYLREDGTAGVIQHIDLAKDIKTA